METTEKIERRGWESSEGASDKYTKRGTGNAALTLGIIGTAGVGLLGASMLSGRGGGLFGGGNSMPQNVNINTELGGYGAAAAQAGVAPTAFQVYEKECSEALALTNELWGMKVNTMEQAYAARNNDVAEKFSLWKGQVDADFSLYKGYRDMGDALAANLNNAAFGLYKNQRDGFDALAGRISCLEKEVAVSAAVRPYQDKLLQAMINEKYVDAVNYTNQKTCKCIYGEVVLPSTPVVTGYGSYTGCSCAGTATA
jgi:hypothetical protein